MKTSNKIRSIAAVIMAVTLAAPGGVWAGGGYHQNKGHSQNYGHHNKGHSKHYGHHDKGRYSKWRRNGNYHYNNHYYGGGYAKSGYGYYGHGNYHDNDDDDDDDLWIGLAAGGLLGYIVGDAVNQPTYVTPSYQPAVVYPATSTVTSAPAYQGQSCLQEREYQTKVIVGGRQVDAYGTACLQPDGSWLRGPAQAAAY
jgi:hypothetical protein